MCGEHQDLFLWTGAVDGKPNIMMRVDTGSSRTMVRSDLLDKAKKEYGTISVQMADGSYLKCPLFHTEIVVNGNKYCRTVAAINMMLVPVLLGRDLPLDKMIRDHLQGEESLTITTRSQTREQGEDVDKRSLKDEDRRSLENKDKRSLEDEDKRSLEDEDKRSLEDEDRRSLEDEDKRSLEDEDRRSLEDKNKKTLENENKRSLEEEDKRSLKDENKRSLEDEVT